MRENQSFEEPLDLLQTTRDELIQGRCPGHLAPQTETISASAELLQPKLSRHCDTALREVVVQSELLSVNPAMRGNVLKPR